MPWEQIVIERDGQAFSYTDWREPLPRVRPPFLKSIVYLYPDELDATGGSEIGGSGFLVEVKSGEHSHAYAVTNAHVIDEGSPVVRVNLKTPKSLQERTLPFVFEPESWVKHDTHDLAVRPMPPDWPMHLLDVSFLNMMDFLSQEDIGAGLIGPGDELFYVGRFMDHAGKWENLPSVRLGNISMLPNEREPVEYKTPLGTRRTQVGFLVEARSRGGYSGSPVFMYKQNAYGGVNNAWAGASYSPTPVTVTLSESIFVLGVDWGHIHEHVRLIDAATGVDLPSAVKIHAGMMGVVPIWFLREFLENHPRLIDQRARDVAFRIRTKGAIGAVD